MKFPQGGPNDRFTKYSPAGAIASVFRRFSAAARKYRMEWWILVAGIAVVATVLFMTAFPQLFTSFSPVDQNAGPSWARPASAIFSAPTTLGATSDPG
jgi:hypothetical protein